MALGKNAAPQGLRGVPSMFSLRRVLAVVAMIFVATIWATSFVGVRYLVKKLGPFTLAGLRYFLGAMFLLPWLRRRSGRKLARCWKRLLLIGICQYTVANGLLFWSLRKLSAAAGALGSCLSSVPVLLLGMIHLHEWPSTSQMIGLGTVIGGSFLFFKGDLTEGDPEALVSLGVAVLAFSVLPVWGRGLAREGEVDIVPLTTFPLAIGGGLALIIGLAAEGVPHLSSVDWGMVIGLAAVNTSLAYFLFNWALKELYVLEANVIANLSPIGTAVIAQSTLGEHLSAVKLGFLLAIVIGASLSQVRGRRG